MVHTPLSLRRWTLVDSPGDLIVQEQQCLAGRDFCCFQKSGEVEHHPSSTSKLHSHCPLPTCSGEFWVQEPIWGKKQKMEGHQKKSTGEVMVQAITEAFTQAIPGKSQVTGKDARTGTKGTHEPDLHTNWGPQLGVSAVHGSGSPRAV